MIIWQRIGNRCGPNHDKLPPNKLPARNEWVDDRGQFIGTEMDIRLSAYFLWEESGRPISDGVEFWLKAESLIIVWRRGRWEKRHDKLQKREVIDFYHYGPGYSDYECTQLVYPEEDFNGCE